MALSNEATLRAYLARILGWTNEDGIQGALRLIELSASYQTALVLLGEGNIVPIAMALHRRIVGAGQPFVLCDPRRANAPASVRTPVNVRSGAKAVRLALGGSLCLREDRMPHDRRSMATLIRGPGNPTQLIICGHSTEELHPYLLRPAPILIPPMVTRAREISRIVDEYALDAIEELSADATGFARQDREWVLAHAASTLSEIETATRRLVALRQAGNVNQAAKRLGVTHVALTHWFDRRGRARPRKGGK